MTQQKFLRLAEVAEKTRKVGVPETWLRKLAVRKVVPTTKIGGKICFPLPAVEHIISVQNQIPKKSVTLKIAAKIMSMTYTLLINEYADTKNKVFTVLGKTWPIYCDISGHRFYMRRKDVEIARNWRNAHVGLPKAAELLGVAHETLLDNVVKGEKPYARVLIHGTWENLPLFFWKEHYYAKKKDVELLRAKKNRPAYTLKDAARYVIECEAQQNGKTYSAEEIDALAEKKRHTFRANRLMKDETGEYLVIRINRKSIRVVLERRPNKIYISNEEFARFCDFVRNQIRFRATRCPINTIVKDLKLPSDYLRKRIFAEDHMGTKTYVLRFGYQNHKLFPTVYIPVTKIEGQWCVSSKDKLRVILLITKVRQLQQSAQEIN